MLSLTLSPGSTNVLLLSLGALTGPLSSGSTAFSPADHLDIFVNGIQIAIQSWLYWPDTNQYSMYTAQNIQSTDVVQVQHHMPSPPFSGSNGELAGFTFFAWPIQ